MEKYILITAVGNTDPISGNKDGSMLHICRHYKPCKVYLYMSKDILKNHRNDNRYFKAIDYLSEQLKLESKIEYEEIANPDLVEVHKFEYFYDEFLRIIRMVRERHPDSKIILNISSGSPAMKAAFLIIDALLNDDDIIAVQVSALPEKRNKETTSWKENFDRIWEVNEDNRHGDHVNRIDIQGRVNLIAQIKKDIICKQIDAYDYHAAYIIANEINNYLSPNALYLLNYAVLRLDRNSKEIDELHIKGFLDGYQYNICSLPSRHRDIFEFILWLQVKVARKEYDSFLRGITPVVLEVLVAIVNSCLNIDFRRDYCEGEFCILRSRKLKSNATGNSILDILNSSYKGEFKDKPLSSEYLFHLLLPQKKNNSILCKNIEPSIGLDTISMLKRVEKKARNYAAHTLVAVSDDWIYDRVGCRSDEIIKALRNVADATILKDYNVDWESYDKMNITIKEKVWG